MTDHPITPPLELMQKWHDQCHKSHEPFLVHIANCATQWSADQELEACIGWLVLNGYGDVVDRLRAARRPKPPSLKEQALMALEDGDTGPGASLTPTEVSIIRRALEALPDD